MPQSHLRTPVETRSGPVIAVSASSRSVISMLVLCMRFQAHLQAKIFSRNCKKYIAPVTVMFMTDAPRSTVLLSLPDRGEALAAPDALFAVWQGLAVYKQQCSLYKLAYRATHNVAVSHIQREKRRPRTVSLDDETIDVTPITAHGYDSVSWRDAGRCG